jgi:parallel beta-helix repeat protein
MATHGIDPQARGLANRPNLSAFAGLTGEADKLAYFTSASAMALTTLVSQARSFLADPDSQYVNYAASGTGASTLTARTKMRQLLHVKDYGVTADGTTDDTAALQDAINAAVAQVADLNFGSGTIIVSSTIDGTALAGTRLFGVATIKGKSSTDFQYLLDISNTTGVTIDGLSFDANAAGRGSATGKLSCLKANTTVFNRLLNLTCKNTLGITGASGSSIAISASGGVSALYADGLVFKTLGTMDLVTPANDKPSDGIFIRGDYCHITNTYGENVTDHVVVLEGCNYSIVANTTCKNCTSFVAMSNDGATNIYGNVINGVSGTCNYFGSFGAALGIYTFSTGWISGCIITNVSVYGATGAAGGGPAVMILGRVEGSLSNLTLQPGGSTGVMNQAILIDTTAGGRGITVSDSILEVEGSASVIRIQNTSDSVRLVNNAIREGAYGIYADGTSNFTVDGNRFVSQSTDKIGLGGSAYYYGDIWQNWTPVFSSDIGNAAATFTGSGAVTVTQAKIIRVGDTVTISLNFDATLLAVSPSYLALTVPSWAYAINNNQWTPANVLNDSTQETGEIRGITGGTFRIYRANIATFSANANVSCHVNFSYPVA